MGASVAEIGSAAQGGLLHYTAREKIARTVARLYARATPKNRGILVKVDELGLSRINSVGARNLFRRNGRTTLSAYRTERRDDGSGLDHRIATFAQPANLWGKVQHLLPFGIPAE